MRHGGDGKNGGGEVERWMRQVDLGWVCEAGGLGGGIVATGAGIEVGWTGGEVEI